MVHAHKMIFLFFLAVILVIGISGCGKKEDYRSLAPYKNPTLALEERVNDLI